MFRILLKKIELLYQLVKSLSVNTEKILEQVKPAETLPELFDINNYYTVIETADVFQVTDRSVWRYLKSKCITAIYFGQTPYFNRILVAEEMKNNKCLRRKKNP